MLDLLLPILSILAGWTLQVSSSSCQQQPPPTPLNSILRKNTTIICDTSFELFGPETVECLEDGVWSFANSFCLKRQPVTNPSEDYELSSINKTSSGSCKATNVETSPWIRVDLQQPVDIHFVQVDFGDSPPSSTTDIEIRIGNATTTSGNPLCYYGNNNKNATVDKLKCNRVIIGQYIFIQLIGENLGLNICGLHFWSGIDLTSCSSRIKSPHSYISNNTCYEFNLQQKTHGEAKSGCQDNSGRLLTTYPDSIKQSLTTLKPLLKKQIFWIAVERDVTSLRQIWRYTTTDQQQSAVTAVVVRPPLPWGEGQPNNYNGEQNCVGLDSMREWRWNDVSCALEFYYICEYSGDICGSPDALAASHVTVMKNGTTAKYNCSDGHVLIGEATRDCKQGRWIGQPPFCKYVTCGTIESTLENGSVIVPKQHHYNAIYQYSCKENYTLVGPPQRRCLESGQWSGSTPKCSYNICPAEVEPLANGTIETSGNMIGNVVKYKCNVGNVLVGPSEKRCVLGGRWEPVTNVSCKYVTCEEHLDIQNGHLNKDGRGLLGDRRQISCEIGYKFMGEEFVCGENGRWKGGGSCEVISCPEPEVPPGSIVTGYEFTYASIIHYTCEEGHFLVGQSERRCLDSGVWSGQVPICEYINCGHVPFTTHASISYLNQSTHLNSIVEYNCAANYKLIGPSRRICQQNTQWSHSTPKCVEVRCSQPSTAIPNTLITSKYNDRPLLASNYNNSFKIGTLLKINCQRGYKLLGQSTFECLEFGTWNNSVWPKCKYVDCNQPPSVQHGNYKLVSNTTSYKSIALYDCHNGYRIVGNERVTCTEDGQWAPAKVTCEPIRCDQIQHEHLQISDNTVGTVGLLRCPVGYNGDKAITCLVNGSWNDTDLHCFVKNCSEPSVLDNGRIFRLNGTRYGSVIEYHCQPGFKLVGVVRNMCDSDGRWVEPLPKCITRGEAGDKGRSGNGEGGEEQLGANNTNSLAVSIIVILIIVSLICLLLSLAFWLRRRRVRAKRKKSTGGRHVGQSAVQQPVVVFSSNSNINSNSPTGGDAAVAVGSSSSSSMVNKPRVSAPMPMVALPPSHYYDNPASENIYEDIHQPQPPSQLLQQQQPQSMVTINGVAV